MDLVFGWYELSPVCVMKMLKSVIRLEGLWSIGACEMICGLIFCFDCLSAGEMVICWWNGDVSQEVQDERKDSSWCWCYSANQAGHVDHAEFVDQTELVNHTDVADHTNLTGHLDHADQADITEQTSLAGYVDHADQASLSFLTILFQSDNVASIW